MQWSHLWKLKLTLTFLVFLFLIGNFVIDKKMFHEFVCEPVSKCEKAPPNYFAAKAAGYAIIAAAFFFVSLVSLRNGLRDTLVNLSTGILSALSAFGSGWNWLKDATNDNPDPYVVLLSILFAVVVIAVVFWAGTTATVIALNKGIAVAARSTKSGLEYICNSLRKLIR